MFGIKLDGRIIKAEKIVFIFLDQNPLYFFLKGLISSDFFFEIKNKLVCVISPDSYLMAFVKSIL